MKRASGVPNYKPSQWYLWWYVTTTRSMTLLVDFLSRGNHQSNSQHICFDMTFYWNVNFSVNICFLKCWDICFQNMYTMLWPANHMYNNVHRWSIAVQEDQLLKTWIDFAISSTQIDLPMQVKNLKTHYSKVEIGEMCRS